jgi:small basic protein (TIGR04137 family)
MSIDSSLKTSGRLSKHRNVLTRAERIQRLADRNRFNADADDPLGLPKVGNRKVMAKKTKKKGPGEEEEA